MRCISIGNKSCRHNFSSNRSNAVATASPNLIPIFNFKPNMSRTPTSYAFYFASIGNLRTFLLRTKTQLISKFSIQKHKFNCIDRGIPNSKFNRKQWSHVRLFSSLLLCWYCQRWTCSIFSLRVVFVEDKIRWIRSKNFRRLPQQYWKESLCNCENDIR